MLDLGADLRSVRSEVSSLRNDVRETAGVVAEAMPRLENLEADLAEAKGTLDALTEEDPEPNNPPVEWPALPAEDAEREWDTLAEWVGDTLVPWLQITRGQLPDIWPHYRRAVFELFWLRTCYRQAYMRKAHPTAAAEWHTRWLDAALENIRKAMPSDWQERIDRQHPPSAPSAQQPAPPAPSPGSPPPGQPNETEPWKQSTPKPHPAQLAAMASSPQPARQKTAGGQYSYEGWREQLATRDHWEQAFQEAKARDLTWRREREQRQIEEDRRHFEQATISTDAPH